LDALGTLLRRNCGFGWPCPQDGKILRPRPLTATLLELGGVFQQGSEFHETVVDPIHHILQ
jgi:hypothetical protein